MLDQVLRQAKLKGRNKRQIANELGLAPDELDGYLFGIAMVAVEGGGGVASDSGGSVRLPALQIVGRKTV